MGTELRKSGRKLPLQLKNAQQESEARQGRAGAKKSAGSSAADMFPDGQGAFNPSAASRQGLSRSRGAKRPDAQGEALTCSCNLLEDLPHIVQPVQRHLSCSRTCSFARAGSQQRGVPV